jgi:chromosome segregation ATPase
MLELQATALPSVVPAARKMVGDVGALLGSLFEEHEQLLERFEHLHHEHRELRRMEADLRREKDETAAALAGVLATHQSLLTAYEARSQALQELGDQFDAFRRERAQMAEEVEALMRRLTDSRDIEMQVDSVPER